MKNTEKKIPALRFPEFSGEWEEKRIENIFSTFKSGNGIVSKEIDESGKYPVYGGNGLRGYTDTYTHDGFYLLIGRQGALCGNINRCNGKVYISEHAIACQANELSDTEFLAQRLEYLNLNKLSESSAQPGLSVAKLLRVKLSIPSLPEQQKIADFLSAVDKRLQLLKDKKTRLEEYKRGVMQRIFSQELRFTRLDGSAYPDWEEKRLGEITEFIRNGLSLTQNNESEGYKVTRIETISDSTINIHKVEYNVY